MRKLVLQPLHHNRQECIGIFFKQDKELNLLIKKLPAIKWSQTNKCWYMPCNRESYTHICNSVSGKAGIDALALQTFLEKKKTAVAATAAKKDMQALPVLFSPAWKLSEKNLGALKLFVEQLKLKAYSSSTITTYRNEFLQLLKLLKSKPADSLTPGDLRRYMVYAIEKQGISENMVHSRLNALKFYYEQVLKKEKFFWEIPRPKKQLQLPRFFNQDEIAAIIKAVDNLKHKTMLMLSYAAGLRVSEVTSIKVSDIDSKRMCILVRQAKGKKDRMVSLSPVLLVMLREYWKNSKLSRDGYLFPGQYKGEPYSSRSVQLVLSLAKKKAGIIKPGSVHALRHSFATHLLDKGTDVTMIQKLLGHNDIKTTLRYLHITNRDMLQIVSPLDDLNLS